MSRDQDVESHHVDQNDNKFEDRTRVADFGHEFNNSRLGSSKIRPTQETEISTDRLAPNQRNPYRFTEPPTDREFNPCGLDSHSRAYSTAYPARGSQVAFEDPYPLPSCARSRRNEYDIPPPSSMFPSTPSTREDPYRRQFDSHPSRQNNYSPSPTTPAHTYEIMRKWNIKYSGTRNDDPDAFLTRIEEGRDLVPISDANLLKVIPFFLSGIALNWFRGSKHLWRTFRQFARAFKIRFGDSDFQFELRQEIHQRTQGEKESVSDYLTCMRVMFDKLTPRMSEAEEISYAHRNLLPRLHLAISRDEIDDFTHLEHLANVAQKSYRVARSYKPPPTPERSLLPDLAYRDPRTRRTVKPHDVRTERLAFLEENEESPPLDEPVDLAYLSLDKNTTVLSDRGRILPSPYLPLGSRKTEIE